MRLCLCLLVAAVLSRAGDPPATVTLHGKLIVREGKPTAIETSDHKSVLLDGDPQMRKVLADTRLNGYQIQAKGHFTAPGKFLLDPIHTRSMLVNQNGHLKMVTYWCDVCSIRSFTPGPCVCCQRETVVDLRDPNDL